MARSRKMRAVTPRVWVVLHCEVALTADGWGVDEDPFCVATSRRSVVRLIRTVHVDPGSWWRAEAARLDDHEGTRADDQPKTEFYSTVGKSIPVPPLAAGYRAALLREERRAEMYERLLSSTAQGRHSKRAIRNVKNTIRAIRRILAHHKRAVSADRFAPGTHANRYYHSRS